MLARSGSSIHRDSVFVLRQVDAVRGPAAAIHFTRVITINCAASEAMHEELEADTLALLYLPSLPLSRLPGNLIASHI